MKESTQPRPLKCIIIDDEAQAADALENFLRQDPRISIIDKICDSEKAMGSILAKKPDVLFLAIQMPVINGFEILEKLNCTNVKPYIIFVTAFDGYAIKAIKSSAFDYLLKPVDETELAYTIERLFYHIGQMQLNCNYSAFLDRLSGKKLKFNSTGGFVLFSPEDILFIQADWNYSEIHLSRDKYEVITLNLGAIEELLPKGRFARINRSVIINLAYLEKIQRGKRLCILKKDGISYEFKIPLLRIRYLEELV